MGRVSRTGSSDDGRQNEKKLIIARYFRLFATLNKKKK